MNKAAIFVALTFALSWPPALIAFGTGMKFYTIPWLVLSVYFMFTPMIAAVITQRVVFGEGVVRPLGVSFAFNRWLIPAVTLPAAITIASTFASVVFPGVTLTTDPSEANIAQIGGEATTPMVDGGLPDLPLHPFIFVLIGGTLAGLTVNGIAGFGEELGWRGLLQLETAGLGFWKSSCLIGVIWGIWHMPFILYGYNYPGYPLVGTGMMIVWTVLFTPLIAYARIVSKSVIVAAMMHGAVNGTAIAPYLVLKGGDSITTGVLGLPGMLVLLCLNVLLYAFGHPGERHNQWIAQTADNDTGCQED
jgi:membrane protease YdiL (CAAX protease family)